MSRVHNTPAEQSDLAPSTPTVPMSHVHLSNIIDDVEQRMILHQVDLRHVFAATRKRLAVRNTTS